MRNWHFAIFFLHTGWGGGGGNCTDTHKECRVCLQSLPSANNNESAIKVCPTDNLPSNITCLQTMLDSVKNEIVLSDCLKIDHHRLMPGDCYSVIR